MEKKRVFCTQQLLAELPFFFEPISIGETLKLQYEPSRQQSPREMKDEGQGEERLQVVEQGRAPVRPVVRASLVRPSPVEPGTPDKAWSRYHYELVKFEHDMLEAQSHFDEIVARLSTSRSEAEHTIEGLLTVNETSLATAVQEEVKRLDRDMLSVEQVRAYCRDAFAQCHRYLEEANRPQELGTVDSQILQQLEESARHSLQLISMNMSLVQQAMNHTQRSDWDEEPPIPGVLYLKVPQDERKKLCKYLFQQETCPHKDCASFVYRLYKAKQTKGEARIWSSDEHELLHIIRETSLELKERLQRERTKQALIRAIHALFDALEDEIANYHLNDPTL
jgi:hypothetical protein